MQVLQKINKYISQILKVALIACFTYMTVVLSLQVFGRYLFHKGFSWTEETARYIMIWAVFLGAAYIALNLEHVKVSIIETDSGTGTAYCRIYICSNRIKIWIYADDNCKVIKISKYGTQHDVSISGISGGLCIVKLCVFLSGIG